MDIAITSRYDVLRKLQEAEFPYQSLISINEPGESMPTFEYSHAGTILPLFFHDIAEELEDHAAPSLEQVTQIVGYAKKEFFNRGSTRMLIHCTAGISRSSAAAIIVAHAVGVDVREYISRLASTRGIHPNPLMIRLADEVFGGGFFEIVRDRLENTLDWGWHHGQEE